MTASRSGPVHGLLQRLRHPQTTVRWRLTLLYGALFLACGAGLLAITYALVAHASALPPGPRTVFRAGVSTQVPARNFKLPPIAPPGVRRLLKSRVGQVVLRIAGTGQRISDLHQLEIESAIALGIMAIVSGLLGWFVSGRVLHPLRTITATTQQISEANLHQRLSMPGPRDELRQLADTIDGLLERLERAFTAQRRFVANASHELRTPLAAARAMLELTLTDPRATIESFRDTCRQVLNENEHQEQLIDALLALAHGQRGIERSEAVDLPQTVREVLDAHRPELAAKGLDLDLSLQAAVVSGDQRLINRLVSNLVENAIRHNDERGQVHVRVEMQGQAALLRIANTGERIPPEAIERLLQPFQRLAPARVRQGEGIGLGLSIVAAIAIAHDASLELRANPQGGLTVEVLFPSTPAPRPDLIPTGARAPGHGLGVLVK